MAKRFSIKKLAAGVLALLMVVTALPVNGITASVSKATESDTTPVYVLYDANRGEHFFTANESEKDNLLAIGWKEGNVAWTSPKTSNTPVYVLYNPNDGGDHYYTANEKEKDNLLSIGWTEGDIKFYSDDAKSVLVNTLYNPNEIARNHHYTVSTVEKESLIAAGWQDHTNAETAIYGVEPKEEIELTAEQTGANTIVAVSSAALDADDVITLKKGSTKQAMTYVLSDDKKTVTITTSNALTENEYTVIVTPNNEKRAEASATVWCEAPSLEALVFSDALALASAGDFYKAYTALVGLDQFGNEFNLGSYVTIYASTALKQNPSYDAKTKMVTLEKNSATQLPFTKGEEITLTAIYQNGSVTKQASAVLEVSDASVVTEMNFGDLETTNIKLKGKRVTYSNFLKGTYYIPVEAKDQYGNTQTADLLNLAIKQSTLFISPTEAQGVYGGVDTTEYFTTLDDGTVALNVGGTKGVFMPGEATLTISALGGFSDTAYYTVEDDPYIDSLNVSFESNVYAKTPSAFTVDAIDQYGDPVDLYECTITGSGTDEIKFGDENHVTHSVSSVKVGDGTITATKKSATKTVEFYWTPTTKGVYTAQITTARPETSVQTLNVGDTGAPASIRKTLKAGQDMTVKAETSNNNVDFGTNLVFVDSNGSEITGTPVAIPTINTSAAYASGVITGGTTTQGTYEYAIFTEKNGTYTNVDDADGAFPINVTTEYTVVLYEYGVKSAAGFTVLDTKKFKITVTTGTYESYTASIKAGDELLYNVTGAKLTGSTDDKATVVVYGTDEYGNTAKLEEGSSKDYTLTVNKNLGVSGSTIIPDAASTVEYGTAGYVETKGTATVTVWASGVAIAETTLEYSNAAPVPRAWIWKVYTDLDDDQDPLDDAASLATGVDAEDAIDLTNHADSTNTTTAGAANTSPMNIKIRDKIGAGKDKIYILSAVDQYGLGVLSFTASLDGVGGAATGTIKQNIAETQHTLLADAGNLETKKIVATMSGTTATTYGVDVSSASVEKGADSKTLTVSGIKINDQFTNPTQTAGTFTVTIKTAGTAVAKSGTYSDGTLTVELTNAIAASDEIVVTLGHASLTPQTNKKNIGISCTASGLSVTAKND